MRDNDNGACLHSKQTSAVGGKPDKLAQEPPTFERGRLIN